MSIARAAARNEPVIVVKAGRAAQDPGADIVYGAAIRRAGMLREPDCSGVPRMVRTLDEAQLDPSQTSRCEDGAR